MLDLPMPDVVTPIQIGDFTLYAYAYRKLTKSEQRFALKQYLRKFKLKSVPKSGSGKVITIIGSIQ